MTLTTKYNQLDDDGEDERNLHTRLTSLNFRTYFLNLRKHKVLRADYYGKLRRRSQ